MLDAEATTTLHILTRLARAEWAADVGTAEHVLWAGMGFSVSLRACDAACGWETLRKWQWKPGSSCLSQHGPAATMEDVAAPASVAATSAVRLGIHGVEGDDVSFWVRKFCAGGPAQLTLDLGGARRLESIAMAWTFPAKSFALDIGCGR